MKKTKRTNTPTDTDNRRRYTQVKVSVPADEALAFKLSCIDTGTSMASAIRSFMNAYTGNAQNTSNRLPPISTRRQRRKAVENSIRWISGVLDAEELYIDNIPENLRGSSVYETAENIIDMLNNAICSLEEIYG